MKHFADKELLGKVEGFYFKSIFLFLVKHNKGQLVIKAPVYENRRFVIQHIPVHGLNLQSCFLAILR